MTIRTLPIGSRGFDTVTTLTPTSAAALKGAGFDFTVRYIGGIGAEEVSSVLRARLALMLVTYSKAPGWVPSGSLGTSEAAADLHELKIVGYPPGATVWIDLEGVSTSASAADVAAWVEARATPLANAGYVVGLYVGYQQPLGGAELFALRNITRYWRSLSAGVPEPTCGFCMMQLFQGNQIIEGINIDFDVTQADYHGRLPTAWAA